MKRAIQTGVCNRCKKGIVKYDVPGILYSNGWIHTYVFNGCDKADPYWGLLVVEVEREYK